MTSEEAHKHRLEILELKDRLQELVARLTGLTGTAALILDCAAVHLERIKEYEKENAE